MALAVQVMETPFVAIGLKEPAVPYTGCAHALRCQSLQRLANGIQFCGKTTAHCGDGCQSGPCAGAPAVPVPGPSNAPAVANSGIFKIVGQSGVPAMHAGLMPNGRVIFLDKVENYTQIKLPDGQYAYSAEYDPTTNTAVGLSYKVNHRCVTANGD